MLGIPVECRAEDARQLVDGVLKAAVPEEIYEGLFNFRKERWQADGMLQELTGGRPPVSLVLEREIIEREVQRPATVRLEQAELVQAMRAPGYYIPMVDCSIGFVAGAETAVGQTLQTLQKLGDEAMLSVLKVEEWGCTEKWQYLPATEYAFVALKWLYVAKMRRFLIGIPK